MFFPRNPMGQMSQMRPMRPPSMFPQQSGFRPPGIFGGMQGMQGMQGMRGMQGQGGGGLGGLLRRLIPGMGQSNPTRGIGGMSGLFNPTQAMNPGTLQSFANPSNLSSMLGNVQKTLKMAESVVPMVQQYGPLMKNIPAMIKMYSALKNSGSEEEEAKEEKEENETISLSDVTSDDENTENEKEKPKAKGSGESVPKLYI
ncbi:spore coat protein [Bacillus sp. HNG]|uniref:VrrA/YqfQ family protein n=1 Tax=Bacillus sp. HNG TaxID=2293325 RepID=UPI000E2F7878|nr:VrrA/YqfQ family protein [Bacillus sp. HNG]RFB17536.1 spore coat protein [Bacillus sp. HNG]